MEQWTAAPWSEWVATAAEPGRQAMHVQVDACGADGTPLLYCAAASVVARAIRPAVHARMLVVDPGAPRSDATSFSSGVRRAGQDLGVLVASKRVRFAEAPCSDAIVGVLGEDSFDVIVFDNVQLLAAIGACPLANVLRICALAAERAKLLIVRVRLDGPHGLSLARFLMHRASSGIFVRPPPSTNVPSREAHGEVARFGHCGAADGGLYRMTDTQCLIQRRTAVPHDWHCGTLD